MQRREGWEARLDELFIAARKRPHAWGTFDCLLWAADGVLALTGHDPAARWRGRYADAAGAWRLMREYLGADVPLRDGFREAARRIAAEIGAREIDGSRARRGDAALVRGEAHEVLAVVDMSARRLATVSPAGLVRVPMTSGLSFWAVG